MLLDDLFENVSSGGYQYERIVSRALTNAGISGKIKSYKKSQTSNAFQPDLDFIIGGNRYLLEVKQSNKSQMGGTSFRYNPYANDIETMFTPVTDIIPMDDLSIIREILLSKQTVLNDYLTHINNHPSNKQNGFAVQGWPFTATRESLDDARDVGLLKQVNTTIHYNTAFIHNHYAKKGIFYIQVGGSGLFHLADNPANLPVPQLKGAFDLEVRSAAKGRVTTANGVVVAGSGLRVQGRWTGYGKSPYTLDSEHSIQKLLARLGTI